MMVFLRNRPWWLWAGLAALPLWAAGQLARRIYAPHYPDIALHAGLALVARPRRVLAIAAHPGDLELYTGGTLFLMAQAKSMITAAVLTAGEAAAGTRKNLTEIRRREQEESAAVIGCQRLIQLGLPDQGLTEHPRLGPQLAEVWNEARPDVILAPDPCGLFPLTGPDAAATGYATIRVAQGDRDGVAEPGAPPLPQQSAALARATLWAARDRITQEPWLLLYGTRRPNLLVDITEVLQEKVQAVKCHHSQARGPDPVAGPLVRTLGRISRQQTAAYYVEGFYRVI